MQEENKQSLRESFRNAWQGIAWAFGRERNFRLHIGAALLAFLAAWRLHLNRWEWAFIILAVFLVLAAELFNTALERVVDLASQDQYRKLARVAKDVAAGAVLLAAIHALVVAILIFGSKILGID
ncbi:MAG: diacylglycerol kinase family protein [Bacillota bacterium]|jgi:diacylglycerol kinase